MEVAVFAITLYKLIPFRRHALFEIVRWM